jgi:PAS domain S-box-containing protein
MAERGTLREFGPCGDVLDRNVPLLFRHFEWRYPYLLPVTPPAEECLLVPFYVEGKAVGTIWAIAHDDRRKFDLEDLRKLVSLGTFASSAYQVTAFLDALDQQGETLRQSEERLRDLYEEAPIAYVKEDLESRFISANRAAQRILGIKPEEVPGLDGMSLVPERPDALRMAREQFALQVRGEETRGVVIELRRKDNGKPVWIEIWAKPEPGGKYTRTMFLDVTDRVLIEQEKARLAAENVYLQEGIKSVHNFEEIVGQSPALLEALEKVSRVSKTDATVPAIPRNDLQCAWHHRNVTVCRVVSRPKRRC